MNRPGIVKHMTLLVVMLAAWSTTSTITAVGSEQFTVLNPTGYAPAIMRKPMAQRQTSLTGKTIYLVDNTFDNGDVYLKEMQKWFTANLPEVKTVFRS